MNHRIVAFCSLALAAVGIAVLAQQPISRFPFDEGAGTNTVDTAGGRTGALVGTPPPIWTSGVSSNSLLFDGLQNEVQVASDPGLTPTNALTLTAWIKVATNATGEAIAKWDSET